MLNFLAYEGRSAAVLLVFYLFYRFLLRKETLHKFNRLVLTGSALLSFILPLCIITIHRQGAGSPIETGDLSGFAFPVLESHTAAPTNQWWPIAVSVIYFIGVAFVLGRIALSVLSILRIIRNGNPIREENDCKIIVTDRDLSPFSWMKYIVLSRKDVDDNQEVVITHEKAHIRNGHSKELLIVDILSAFQWFNPAIWMLRSDLQELHEYEADDAVLRSGTDIKDYQYLLIRKTADRSGYTIANSLNHSTLKNRIAMMSKARSPRAKCLKVLYLLPLVFVGLALQARIVYVPADNHTHQANDKSAIVLKVHSNGFIGHSGLLIPYDEVKDYLVPPGTPASGIAVQIIADADTPIGIIDELKKELREMNMLKVNITQTTPVRNAPSLEEIIVVRYSGDDEKPIPTSVTIPDTMPSFRGGDMNMFSRWMNERIKCPKNCHHSGNMIIGFMVSEDGSVTDVRILESVCEELDAMMIELVSHSPKWEPATLKGQPVAQFLTIPVTFMTR